MRVIGVRQFGGPERLESIELPTPHPSGGEVKVAVRAAAVNPVDIIIRSGAFAGNDDLTGGPVVPGTDVAGEVTEIGPNQPSWFDLVVGDQVTGFVAPSGSHGGYSSEIVLPAESVTRMPSNGGFAEGAAFLSNALTADIALEALDLPAGSIIAVTGATGAVGGYLVQLAAQRGLIVIADSRAAERDFVRALGADHVLDRDADFSSGVRAVTDGRGAAAVADPAIRGAGVLDSVADDGQVAFFLPNDLDPGRGIRSFRSYVMRSNRRHDAIERLARSVERGTLRVRVADVLTADRAADAHRRLEAGGVRGRFVLEF